MKKQGWILKGNEKFALWKCLYFYSKMHWDQDIRLFIFFSSYPLGGILDTLPLLRFQFRFFNFLLITDLFRWDEIIFNFFWFLTRLIPEPMYFQKTKPIPDRYHHRSITMQPPSCVSTGPSGGKGISVTLPFQRWVQSPLPAKRQEARMCRKNTY